MEINGRKRVQSTVAKYMARRRPGSGQTWKTFLRNHVAGIGAMDFLVVPTINFRLLFVLVILRHERRRLISLSVTDHPAAEWIARQITEAFPWDSAPSHLIRDRDASYGHAVAKRLAAMGIRDHPIAPRSPWQNGHAERLIGSIRRECLATSWSWVRAICAGSSSPMLPTTTKFGRICHWRRMHHSIGQSTGLAPSSARQSWADCTTSMAGRSFRKGQSSRRRVEPP